ncbi:hypothetical protein PCE1_004958 [Barthelona sp. PCE]
MDYYNTKESVDQYIRAAEGFDGSDIIQKVGEFLSEGASVLELGSGPGKDAQIMTTKGYQVSVSDYSSEFLSRLHDNYPGIFAEYLQIDATNIISEEKYDCIYSNKVLHFLTDEQLEQSINSQLRCLSTAGIVCHTFWRGEGTEMYGDMYVNNHTEEEMIVFFKDFDILVCVLYEEMDSNDSILVIARRKQ